MLTADVPAGGVGFWAWASAVCGDGSWAAARKAQELGFVLAGNQKRPLDPQNLELQMVVSCHMGARN